MRLRNLIVGALLCASMLIAAPAYAQTASEGYSKPAGSIQERITTQNDNDRDRTPPDSSTQIATRDSSNSGGDLPFTGLDVALIMAAGGVLLAMGFGMRRLSRSPVA